jgi:hypothetical protein
VCSTVVLRGVLAKQPSATPRCNSRTNTKCTHTNATADRVRCTHSCLQTLHICCSCFVITPPPPTPSHPTSPHLGGCTTTTTTTPPSLFLVCWLARTGRRLLSGSIQFVQAISQSSCAPTIVFLSFRPLLGDDDTYCMLYSARANCVYHHVWCELMCKIIDTHVFLQLTLFCDFLQLNSSL